eukprot:COSAG04_NODE_8151_length_1015_cov_2.325328_1_plen_243_part_01
MAAARERWWSCNRVPRLDKDDPSTWLGGFREGELSEDESNAVSQASWDCRQVGGSRQLLDMLPRACWGAVQQLCGAGTMIEPEGKTKPGKNFAHPGANLIGVGSPGQACRGVYCRMPENLSPAERAAVPPLAERASGHCDGWDGTRWRLSLATMLDDVPPNGGALCLWPGSHRRLFPHRHLEFVTTEEQQEEIMTERAASEHVRRMGSESNVITNQVITEVKDSAFRAEMERVHADTAPVECC